jgi:peptidoglycan/LPS O-acetylase OafA/YrhL
MSVDLEGLLGEVPSAWHLMAVADLEDLAAQRRQDGAAGPRRPRWTHVMEANVVLRAAATALIVATHAGVLMLQGGAHVLLAVAGFNFARFRLPPTDRPSQLRDGLTSIARIAVPTLVWLAFQFTYAEPFEWQRALLVNNYLGTGLWEYWYLEALLQILLVLTAVFAWGRARAFERRHPFALALVVLVAATALRFDALDIGHDAHWMYMPDTVLWCFALGWAAQRARGVGQRLAVTLVGAVNVWDFFDKPGRELAVALGLLALVWVARVRVPTGLHRVVAAVAAASLYVYLVQWAVLPPLRGVVPTWVAAVVAIVAGVVAFALAQRIERQLGAWWARRQGRAGGGDGEAASRPAAPAPASLG